MNKKRRTTRTRHRDTEGAEDKIDEEMKKNVLFADYLCVPCDLCG